MSTYRGRFAPTPSGPLHLGSLLTALASYLEARHQQGQWLLRIDDLDRQRVAPGAEAQIRAQLEAHHLLWDEPPRRQSEKITEYQEALDVLSARQLVYACDCTRAQLALSSLPGPEGAIYAGTCRDRGLSAPGRALRLRMPAEELRFDDAGLGVQRRDLQADIGDFALSRRDGVIAYQLACAIDEHAQGITHVVRGADLLGSTFMQLHLMDLLRLRTPRYRHLPVIVDSGQRKFSKQNHALAVSSEQAGSNLAHCLDLLGQAPPPGLYRAAPAEILSWALAHWQPANIPRRSTVEMRTL